MTVEQLSLDLEAQDLELIIGIETHIRLNTATKLFCGCANTEEEKPNQNICPVCTGQMGVLPAVNKEAVKKSILFGKAVKADFNEIINWDRKHYEYPDLPKNFQITQFHYPIIKGGEVNCFREDGSTFSVQLHQVHIEEDAAKLSHKKNTSWVDFNKGGVPLIEVVTEPCIRNMKDASIYAQYLQRIAKNLNISEANLDKGQFKSDVSISLRKKGTTELNPRAEIKNLNSFKFMIEALVDEVGKQLAHFKEHGTAQPDQKTVLWNEELKQTKTMRKKEYDADYRYIPEPDLPTVDVSAQIAATEIDMALLPYEVEEILIKGKVRPQDAKFFTSDVVRSKLFLKLNEAVKDTAFVAKALTNTLKPDDYAQLIEIDGLTDIFAQYKSEKISIILFQQIIKNLLKDPAFDYQDFIEKNSVSEEKLNASIQEVIDANQALAEQIKAGKKAPGILVGKVIGKVGKSVPGKLILEKISELIAAGDPEGQEETAEAKQAAADKKAEQENQKVEREPILVKEEYQTHFISEITDELLGQEVTLCGWVSSLRDHGDLVFIDQRDPNQAVIQLRLSKEHIADLDTYARIKPESVVMATGVLVQRDEDDYNPSIKTGKIELDCKEVDIINSAETLPFEIKRAVSSNENVRLKYKFLDHRNPNVRKAIVNRHRVIKLMRDMLDEDGFLEIETPILSAGTDEGAREFLVPSRKYPGKFYTLPQAPQQFKQMLMVSGYGRYFQFARCFRDEDSRGDRQPEFTQLDIELSYASMKTIMDINSKLLVEVVKRIYGNKWKLFPFKVLTYHEAMEKYGCDRPDLRFGLEMMTITDILRDTDFKVFSEPIAKGGIVKCIKVPACISTKRISKGQIEKLTQIAQDNGLGGLAYIIVNENDLQSPIIKFLGEDVAKAIVKVNEAEVGDVIFFSAADYATANKALDQVRQELGRMFKLIKPNELHPGWVVDFPLFEETEEGGWTFTHNPFSMPKVEDIEDHLAGRNLDKIISQQYDLILNGSEIGGGSVRAHKQEILAATFKNMGYDFDGMMKSIGELYDSFRFGTPPHGGIAWGIDRLMMILEKKSSIREVIAFPKTGASEDLLFNAPSPLGLKKVEETNVTPINVTPEEE